MFTTYSVINAATQPGISHAGDKAREPHQSNNLRNQVNAQGETDPESVQN